MTPTTTTGGVERFPARKAPPGERGAKGRGSGHHSRFVEEALDVPASRRRLVLLRRACTYAPTLGHGHAVRADSKKLFKNDPIRDLQFGAVVNNCVPDFWSSHENRNGVRAGTNLIAQ
jgi:hypothetical protein